ncbi:MAG: hypothetical protein JOZ96_02610 [Acidobacteria bacterium]|nr:hypothetical protein [Acidobacteriota bacterium]
MRLLALSAAAAAALCLLISAHAARTANVTPAPPAQAKPFGPGCALPFDAIEAKHPIDGTCPSGGKASLAADGSQPHVLQNLAKNNFCVTDDPTPISYNAFVALQAAVNKMSNFTWGSGEKMPADRSPLQNLKIKDGGRGLTVGEGSKVSFVGYVMAYEFADAEKGEDVNCDLGGDENNDIHLTLRTKPRLILKRPPGATDPRCNSVSAEVSPHFRPAAWSKLAAASSNTLFAKYPLRITGALTFDAEHLPCVNGKPHSGSPVRISVWEIHPVYSVDVCKYATLARCQASNDAAWTPFDQKVAQ